MRLRKSTQARRLALGFSLVEMLLAIAITSILSAAVVGLLFATVHGAGKETGVRTLAVKSKVAGERIGAAFRSARMVLAQGPDYVILWMSDKDESGSPRLSEIQRIERHSGMSELRSYKAPNGLAAKNDPEFPLATTDFNTVTNLLKGTETFPKETWCTEVSAGAFTLNNSDPQKATLLSYQLTLLCNQQSGQMIGSTKMRYAHQ